MPDHYEVLGVSPTASADEIKQQYRFQQQAFHPDRWQNEQHRVWAEARAKVINAAYEVLSDPLARRAYDRQRDILSSPAQPPRPAPSSQPQPTRTPVPPPVEPKAVFECALCGFGPIRQGLVVCGGCGAAITYGATAEQVKDAGCTGGCLGLILGGVAFFAVGIVPKDLSIPMILISISVGLGAVVAKLITKRRRRTQIWFSR